MLNFPTQAISTRILFWKPSKAQSLESYNLLPTCQGYSLATVSTPPTILVTLLAWPQLHVAVVVVAVVVVVGLAVVVPGVVGGTVGITIKLESIRMIVMKYLPKSVHSPCDQTQSPLHHSPFTRGHSEQEVAK